MSHNLGDAPIEPKYEKIMLEVAYIIDHFFNGNSTGLDRTTGFVLLVFPFGEEKQGRCNYLSNGADRDDIIKLFEEQVKRFKDQKKRETH